MRRTMLFLSMMSVAVLAAYADSIVPISEFTGAYSDGFETQVNGTFISSANVFGDGSTVQIIGGSSGMLITEGWDFFSLTYPHGGDYLMGSAHGEVQYVLAQPAQRFGGFFNANSDVAGATVSFFDAFDNLLGTLTATAPLNGQWAWNGWETTSAGIKRIDIIGNSVWGEGGFVMQDDITYSPMQAAVPEPASLVLLGTGLGVIGLAGWRRRK